MRCSAGRKQVSISCFLASRCVFVLSLPFGERKSQASLYIVIKVLTEVDVYTDWHVQVIRRYLNLLLINHSL